jgi:hypothetical protein
MEHYDLWSDEFKRTLTGELLYTLDYLGAAEDSRREKKYFDEQREKAKNQAHHPGIEFAETEEEYEDTAQDARERLAAERAKRKK